MRPKVSYGPVGVLLWQVPISTSKKDQVTAHLFKTGPTNVLERSFCGRDYNPGFAVPATPQDRKCVECVTGLYESANEAPGIIEAKRVYGQGARTLQRIRNGK